MKTGSTEAIGGPGPIVECAQRLTAVRLVPATECSRIAPERLELERGQMGDAWFRQEYLCEFVDNGNAVFGRDLVERALDDELEPLEA